ncbi:MAG TPA: LuxR C-terminal-related transcriptional regulator [Thermoleophilaceae bacterium]|nr:LuxR C-terminal-related transcriptional regulator [Thermoleophilaceae bacterium]
MNAASSGWATRSRDEPDGARTGAERISLAGAEQVAKVGTWRFCPETGELRWSDNLFRLHGLEPGEAAPGRETLLGSTHPDDVARVEAWADSVKDGEIPGPIDFRVILSAGGVRYLRSTVSAIDQDRTRPPLMVGSVQDLTAEHLAKREIESRFAVTSALATWTSFEEGMRGLLRELALAIGARVGTAWLPDSEALLAKVFWSEDVAATFEFEVATRSLNLPPGTGLPGRVWESRSPGVELTASPDCERSDPAELAGVRGLLAVPVVHADEVLAVVELACPDEIALTTRSLRSMTAIGYEVGEFLAHRRGELEPPALTARELEVIQLAAHGHSSREIAKHLRVSPATIKTHLEHIYSKFGVSGRAAAVAQAMRAGLIT